MVITRSAQNAVRIIGLLSCLCLLIVTLFVNSSLILFLIVTVFIGISLLAIYVVTDRKRRYYFPLVFMLFYIVGYILAFAHILFYRDKLIRFSRVGWFPIGSFGFTDKEWFQILMVILFGLAGMLCTVLFHEAIFKRGRVAESRIFTILHRRRSTANLFIALWFLFSITIMFTMLALGIGRHGLAETRQLPFKATGLLLYIRNYIVPFAGFVLMDVFAHSNRKRLRNITIFLLVLFSALNSLLFYSRIHVIMIMFTVFIYFFLNIGQHGVSMKRMLFYFALTVPAIAVILFAVTKIRSMVYYQTTIGNPLVDLTVGMASIKEALYLMSTLLLTRTEGIRMLLAVVSSSLSGVQLTWGMFMGDEGITRMIVKSVFGFLPIGGEGAAYGVTMGIWGFLFMSKSYIVLFIGTMLYTSFALFVEELFRRKGLRAGALFFAVSIGVMIWMNMVLFFLIRIVAMVVLAYFFIRFIESYYGGSASRTQYELL